jgi:hypothetical protein
MYQRIVKFSDIQPGERFASSMTGTVYRKVDDRFGEEERGDTFGVFPADQLVYTNLPHWGCFSRDPDCVLREEIYLWLATTDR